jgi:putative polysaccharide biosynthesis protein
MRINTLKKGITYLRYYGIYSVENILFYGGKMVGRVIFPFMLIFGKRKNKESCFSQCELKNHVRIFFEQLWYILRTGEMNKYYYAYGFERKSKNDFKNYVPWLVFTNSRNRKNQLPSTPTYDSYNYICMLRDKFVFESFCKRVGINTPTNIGMINDGFFHIIKEQKALSLNNINQIKIDAFLKKNVSYGGGMRYDVMPMRIENGVIYLNDTLIEIDDFIDFIGSHSWVVQERIKNQHDALSKLHPCSINTIRIVTVKAESKIEILCSSLRVGINGSSTDNISSGGIVINIMNGMLEKYGLHNPGLEIKTDRHPDTKVVFENFKIPFWNEIIDSVKNAHRLFYGLHSIGWDVCVTHNGIALIEGNDNWDTVFAQLSGGAKNEYLKYFKN